MLWKVLEQLGPRPGKSEGQEGKGGVQFAATVSPRVGPRLSSEQRQGELAVAGKH